METAPLAFPSGLAGFKCGRLLTHLGGDSDSAKSDGVLRVHTCQLRGLYCKLFRLCPTERGQLITWAWFVDGGRGTWDGGRAHEQWEGHMGTVGGAHEEANIPAVDTGNGSCGAPQPVPGGRGVVSPLPWGLGSP